LAVFLSSGVAGQPVASALCFGFFTVMLCNLVNNQPASILLSRVLLEPCVQALDFASRQAAVLGCILGCNLAANMTPIGALAGLLFLRLVEIHKAPLTVADFVKTGLTLNTLVCVVGFVILAGESVF